MTSQLRVSFLGGEVEKRGILARAPQSRISRVTLVAGLAFVLLSLLSGVTVVLAVVNLLILIAVWTLTWPRAQEPPRLDSWLRRRRAAARRRSGHARFVAPAELHPGHRGPAWKVPGAVGRVEPLDLTGTPYESLFVLHHTNPAGHFLTVLAATDGLGSGLRSDEQYARTQEDFGRLLAVFASRSRHISGFQQINRVVPHDALEHEDWMITQLSPPAADAPPAVKQGYDLLVKSYSQLVSDDAATAEQHRNYLVARFDITPEFLELAARFGKGNLGMTEIVVEELRLLRDRISGAGLGSLTVLGEQRTVAAMRALQSPDYAPDRHGGCEWANAFLSFETTTHPPLVPATGYFRRLTRLVGLNSPPISDHMTVEDRWLTRTGYIPRGGIAQARFGPRWLAGVLTDISPAVVRTVSTRINLIPANIARAEAVKDLTSDAATEIKEASQGKIDDGTGQAMKSASTVRLTDLAPGSGNAGVQWGLFITVQARTADELADASARLVDALTECGITHWQWADDDHDLAWVTTLPLARGLAKK